MHAWSGGEQRKQIFEKVVAWPSLRLTGGKLAFDGFQKVPGLASENFRKGSIG